MRRLPYGDALVSSRQPIRAAFIALCLAAAAAELFAQPQGPVKIVVTCGSASLAAGLTTQCSATKMFFRGSAPAGNATQSVRWISSNQSIATVSNSSGQQGTVTAVSPGTVSIIAASGPFRASFRVTVTQPVLVSMSIAPPNANIQANVGQAFTASGLLSNGQPATLSVTWKSSNTAVANITTTGVQTAVATGGSSGSTTITATDSASGMQATAALNVGLTGISVSPANPGVALGLMQPFTATGTFGTQQQDVTQFVVWSSSDQSVATISASGVASTLQQGSSTITASSGSASGSTLLSVGPPALASVVVSPSSATMVAGESLQLTATAVFTDASKIDVTQTATWNSSIGSVASVSSTGLVAASSTGSSTISAMYGGFTASSQISVRPASRFLLAANSGDSTVSVYSLDEISGRMRPQGYAFVAGAQQLGVVAVAPGVNRIYVPDAASGSTNVYGYAVDSASGRLQAISTSPFLTTGAGPSCVAINPAGTYAYVTDEATSAPGVVSAFVIGSHDGALAPQAVPSYAAGSHPACAVVDPSGNFLYVANSGSGSVSEYRIASDGSLTSVGTIASGSKPQALAFDPSGKFLLVANSAGASVSVFAMNSASGALTAISGSPFGTGATPASIAFDPVGTHVYIANQGAKSISGFSFNATTGGLSAISGSPFSLSGAPGAIATDAAGLYLFASIPASNELLEFALGTSGALTLMNDQRARTEANSLALASGNAVKYVPAYAEVANQASGGGISSYSIDATSGALSPVDGFAIGAQGAFGVAADQFGRFVFATNDDNSPGTVSSFVLNLGFLNSSGPSIAAGAFPQALIDEPSGRFIYALNLGDSTISEYSVQTSGALTALAGSPFASAPGPNAVAVDPTGRFLYVCSFTGAASDGIAAYRIDPATGSLSAVAGFPFALARPLGPAVHPSGNFLYALSGNGINVLQPFAIDGLTGALTTLGAPLAVGQNPVAIALDGDGRFLYVANNNDSTVSAFAVASNGTLAPVSGSPFATAAAPIALAVDASGSFLYVATSSGAVSIFAIDANTGALSNRSDATIPANMVGIALTGTMN